MLFARKKFLLIGEEEQIILAKLLLPDASQEKCSSIWIEMSKSLHFFLANSFQ